MDVTSLLNASSAAYLQRRGSIDQTPTPSATGSTTATSTAVPTPSPEGTPPRRASGSQSPNRNRTPWDAGGYSLPLALDTKSIPSFVTTRPSFYSESSPTDYFVSAASPQLPKHKFSDSRSSLSSYTSSSNDSVSHSRISSLSTVSEFQPLTNLITDFTFDSSNRPSADAFDMTSKACPVLGVVQPPSPGPLSRRNDGDDTTSPLSAGDIGLITHTGTYAGTGANTGVRRPGSPSDAVIIRRDQNGNNSPIDVPSQVSQDGLNNLSLPDGSSSNRAHKRSVSAPDAATVNSTSPHSLGPVTGDASSSQRKQEESYADDGDVKSIGIADVPETSVTANIDDEDFLGDPVINKCMHIDNCNTNSQPRKVISHIFGRNKLCTRSIPDYVWVRYCRKHYQRSRYRNVEEYAKRQCELVQQQVARVQAWSNKNQREGTAGIVQSWSLSIRKREQRRLEEKNANRKRRRQPDDDDDDMSDDTINDRAVAAGTAVPQWLLDKCGSGYSTAQITQIIAQLQSEMEAGHLPQIPDIEILPNVVTDKPEEAKSKSHLRRKSNANNGHRRVQSTAGAMGSHSRDLSVNNSYPVNVTRRADNQPPNSAIGTGYWESFESYGSKRQRLSEMDSFYGADRGSTMVPPRSMDRTVPMIGRIGGQASHRVPFDSFPGDAGEGRPYDERQGGATTGPFGYSTIPSPNGPLPAPTPQRITGAPMAQQLESATPTHGFQDTQSTRSFHQRSCSDANTPFHQTPQPQMMGYRPTSSGYPNATTAMMGFSSMPQGALSGYSRIPAANGYAPVPHAYDASASPYAADYIRPDGTWGALDGAAAHGASGYYTNFSARQQQTQQTQQTQPTNGYTTPSYAGYQPVGAGGVAKHMRHQSQPAMPRLMQGGPAPMPVVTGHQQSQMHAPHAPHAPYGPGPVYRHHHQSYGDVHTAAMSHSMQPVDESGNAHDGGYHTELERSGGR